MSSSNKTDKTITGEENKEITIPNERFNNPAFKGAYRKGAIAAVNGEPKTNCPYDRDNYGSQGVTFSRAFWRRWMEGYNAHTNDE